DTAGWTPGTAGATARTASQLTLTTVSVRLPRGRDTEVWSPGARPSRATATGDSAERRPSPGAASWELTIRQVCSRPSGSRTTTVEPNPTTPALPEVSSSTITASAIFSRSLAILVSRWVCSFLASLYSLFSFRSPHSRAVLMRSAISRRPSPSSTASSALRASRPSAVIRLVASCTTAKSLLDRQRGPCGREPPHAPQRSEVGARRRGQQRVDLHDGGLVEQLRGGGRSGHEQVAAQAQVLPGVVDVCLGDLRPGRVVGDGVEIHQVAEVDGGEERVLGAEAFGREVGARGLGGLAGLVEVGGVAGRLVEQRAGPDHDAPVVAPQRGFDHALGTE